MGLTLNRVIELADRVGRLNPKPGLKLSPDEVEVVILRFLLKRWRACIVFE